MLLEIQCIPSSSMYPTLRIGDRMLVEKASYYIRNPSIDDIITFGDPTQCAIAIWMQRRKRRCKESCCTSQRYG
ncbi:Thylakoidal processing peptidase 1, chloroplastic, partial [Cucurbita argyrosperma subsp. sororia]